MKTYHAIQTCICCTQQYAKDLGLKRLSKVEQFQPELSHCFACGSSSVVKLEKIDQATAVLLNRKSDGFIG